MNNWKVISACHHTVFYNFNLFVFYFYFFRIQCPIIKDMSVSTCQSKFALEKFSISFYNFASTPSIRPVRCIPASQLSEPLFWTIIVWVSGKLFQRRLITNIPGVAPMIRSFSFLFLVRVHFDCRLIRERCPNAVVPVCSVHVALVLEHSICL